MEIIKYFFDNSGGINVQGFPIALLDNEMIHVENFILNEIGYFETRPGYSLKNVKPIIEDGSEQEITSIHQHTDKDGTQYLFACAGTKIYLFNTTTEEFEEITGGTGLTNGLKFSIKSWINDVQDYVIFSNGTDNIKKYDVSTDEITDLIDAESEETPKGDILEVWKRKVYVADSNSPTLYYSNLNDCTKFDSADYFNTLSEVNFGITGLLGMSFGVYVFHRDSIELLELMETTIGFGSRPIDADFGCIAHRTIKRVKSGCMFLSERGVVYLESMNSVIVSQKIDSILGIIDNENLTRCVGINYSGSRYPRNHYFLSIPILLKKDIQLDENNIVLVYFYKKDAWHIFKGIGANCFCLAEDSNDREILYFGDIYGNVYQYDIPNIRSDNDKPIKTELIKILNLGAIDNFKQANKLQIFYQAENDVSLTIITQGIGDDFDGTSSETSISLTAEGDEDKEIYDGLTDDLSYLNKQSMRMKEFGIDFKGKYLMIRLSNNEIDREFKIMGFGIKYSIKETK